MYIIDSSSLLVIFTHYYKSRFPSFWNNFDKAIQDMRIISVREVFNEINNHSEDLLTQWSKSNRNIFEEPEEEELEFIHKIFAVDHFQTLISRKSMLRGKPVADPFIIAKAKCKNSIVITQEELRPNAAKIPNVCKHFGVEYVNLDQFMGLEKWIF